MMHGSLERTARLGSGIALALLMAVSVSPAVRGHSSALPKVDAASGQAPSSAAMVKVDFDPQDELVSPDVAHRNW